MRQWIARPRRANGYAVVASILLVGGIVVLSLRWASIDSHQLDALEMDELAQQLAQRHNAASPPNSDWPYSSQEQAAYELSRALQIDRIIIFDLVAQGLRFTAANSIRDLPVPVVAHVVYEYVTGEHVSVFMLPNRGDLAVRPTLPTDAGREVWMRWMQADGGHMPTRALMGSDEWMIYVVVSRDVQALEAAAGRIGGIVSQP